MLIDVAAGALLNAHNEVLLAQRPEGKHMAGFWEFPGGKFELGENAASALYRELREELGIEADSSEPLIEITHHYPDRSVRLHVRCLRRWQGQPQSLDNQALAWVPLSELSQWSLLPADGPIVQALLLPRYYAVSPSVDELMPWLQLERSLEALTSQGISLLQWRQQAFAHNQKPSAAALAQAAAVAGWAKQQGVTVLLNAAFEPGLLWAEELGFDGLHLSERSLQAAADKHDLAKAGWHLAASCHSAESLRFAASVGCDFAVLGTVLATDSHPQAKPLGWLACTDLLAEVNLPVYAIGGCGPAQLGEAIAAGAQGVAGISAFWPSAD